MSLALSRPTLIRYLLLASVAPLFLGVFRAVIPVVLVVAYGGGLRFSDLIGGLGWVAAGALGSLLIQALARIVADLGEIRGRFEDVPPRPRPNP